MSKLFEFEIAMKCPTCGSFPHTRCQYVTTATHGGIHGRVQCALFKGHAGVHEFLPRRSARNVIGEPYPDTLTEPEIMYPNPHPARPTCGSHHHGRRCDGARGHRGVHWHDADQQPREEWLDYFQQEPQDAQGPDGSGPQPQALDADTARPCEPDWTPIRMMPPPKPTPPPLRDLREGDIPREIGRADSSAEGQPVDRGDPAWAVARSRSGSISRNCSRRRKAAPDPAGG